MPNATSSRIGTLLDVFHILCGVTLSTAPYLGSSRTAGCAVCLTSAGVYDKVCSIVPYCACECVIHEGESIIKPS